MDMGSIALSIAAVEELIKGESKSKTEDAKRSLTTDEVEEEDHENRLHEMMTMSAGDAMMQKLKKINADIPEEKLSKVKLAELRVCSAMLMCMPPLAQRSQGLQQRGDSGNLWHWGRKGQLHNGESPLLN